MPISEDTADISACVDAIVARFNDATTILQRVKAVRATKQAAPPSRYLEETIQCAPEDILKEKERGLGRFGLAFQQGDEVALEILRQVNTTLHTRLVDELQRLAQTEDLADFRYLVDEADCGRDQTIDALIRLRQRCLSAEATEMSSRHSSDTSIATKDLPSPPLETTNKTYSFPQHYNPWLRLQRRGHSAVPPESKDGSGDEDAQSGAEASHKKHHGSILNFLKHHRAHSHGDRSTERPSDNDLARRSRASTTMSDTSSLQQNRSSISLAVPTNDALNTLQRQSSDLSHRDSSASVDTIVGLNAANRRNTAASTATSVLRHSSLAVPTPNQDNDYLGFCKAAVRMQNGDRKAMEKRREFNDGWSQATVYYLGCSARQCAFAGHIDINVVMIKVFLVESKGLAFRWPFLAKSHVMQHRNKEASYKCLFCVFSGETSEVYYGVDAYIDHVSTHRGGIGTVTLYKARCINDHIADASEEFDINLFPQSGERDISEHLAESLTSLEMSPIATGKKDSVLETRNEPWNQGLSDFHYKDEFERGEMG